MSIQKAIIAVLFILHIEQVVSQEAKVILRSTVTGNQEQPKVLYIVPWQRAESLELGYQPLQSLVGDVFEEVERGEFLRELRYRENIESSLQTDP